MSTEWDHDWDDADPAILAAVEAAEAEASRRKKARVLWTGEQSHLTDEKVFRVAYGGAYEPRNHPQEPEGEYLSALRGSKSPSFVQPNFHAAAGHGQTLGGGARIYAGSHRAGGGSGDADRCFKCQQQGHWAKDCPDFPNSWPKGPGPSGQSDAAAGQKLCACGAGPCRVLTSQTPKNPGRQFFCCPGLQGFRCSFFEWCDLPPGSGPAAAGRQQSQQSDGVPELPCPCGAGPCAVRTAKTDKNLGRRFYACPSLQSCNFFQWYDEGSPVKATWQQGQRSGESPTGGAKPGLCYKCQQPGHWARMCPSVY